MDFEIKIPLDIFKRMVKDTFPGLRDMLVHNSFVNDEAATLRGTNAVKIAYVIACLGIEGTRVC